MLRASFAIFVHFAALNVPASPRDWPEFRGPTGQGHANVHGLPLHWNTTSNIVWRTEIPGLGWSSPVLHEGRIYLTTAGAKDGEAPKLRAVALDAATGWAVWDVEVFRPSGSLPIHNKNSHASPTAVIGNGRLFVHFGPQGTACLDLKGEVLWRNTSIRYSPVHGSGGSPVLVDDFLIFSCDGASDPFVTALNRETGKVVWKTPRKTTARKTFSFSTPLALSVNNKTQVISPGSGVVCAYEPASGREIWRVRYNEGYSVIPRPVFGHGLVFLSSGYDRPIVHAIRPDGKGDVTSSHVAWTLNKGAPNTPSLLLAGDDLYMVSDGGIASCVDATTGKVHWQERLGGDFSASPLFAEGRLYFLNEQGTTFVVKAGRSFEKLAENPLNEKALASPAAGEGALFIRTEKQLFRIGRL